MIEALNQLAQFNRRRFLSANMTLRQRTTEAVMNLLSGQKEKAELDADTASLVADQDQHPLFNPQERLMIERVLNLNQRSVSSIMTSRHDIERINQRRRKRSAARWRKSAYPAGGHRREG